MSRTIIECPVGLDVECLFDCEDCNYYKFFIQMENNNSEERVIKSGTESKLTEVEE